MKATTLMTWTLRGLGMAAALTIAAQPAVADPIGAGAPETAFTEAGLGPSAGWTLLPDGTWGTGGTNPFFADGGTVEFVLRLADFGHIFGTSDTDGSLAPSSTIFDTSVQTQGATTSFVPVTNPFAFFFQNTAGGGTEWTKSNGIRTSDQLDIAIYRNIADPTLFAFFYDDGGGDTLGDPEDDEDYNDMVVTARPAAVPEPATILLLGTGLLGAVRAARRRKQ